MASYQVLHQDTPMDTEYNIVGRDDILDDIECPITGYIFNDPVKIKETGKVFERDAIVSWFQISDKCPLTGVMVTDKTLEEDVYTKELVMLYLETNPDMKNHQYKIDYNKKINELIDKKHFDYLINYSCFDFSKIKYQTIIKYCTNKHILTHVINNAIIYQSTPIMWFALKYCNLDIIKLFVSLGVELNVTHEEVNMLFLIFDRHDSMQVLEYFLDFELDFNIINPTNGMSFFQYAIIKKIPETIIIKLLAKNIDLEYISPQYNTHILQYAVRYSTLNIIKLLVEYKQWPLNDILTLNNCNLLYIAIEMRDTQIVKYLIDLDISLILPNHTGDTPIHVAFCFGSEEVITSIITKLDGNIFIPNNSGIMPPEFIIHNNKLNDESKVYLNEYILTISL